VRYLQAGIWSGGKGREQLALVIGYLLGNIGSIITIKNEYHELKINKLNTEIRSKLNEIREGNSQFADIKQTISEELTNLALISAQKGKYAEYIKNLNEINLQLNENIAKFQNKSLSDETVAYELLGICEGIKGNISKFSQAQSKIETALSETAESASSSADQKVTPYTETKRLKNSDHYRIEGIDDINKSSIINFDFDSSLT
jgi:hypothetical protein